MAKGPWFREQNKTWYVQLAGRQINLGKDKTAAFREWHRLKGNGAPLKDHPVRAVLEAHWTWLQSNRSPETWKPREKILKTFGLSIPPKLRVSQLRPFHVQAWIDKNYATNGPTRKADLIATIKTAINWGVKMGYADASPIATMEKPERQVRQEFVPFDQWQTLLDSCKPDLRDFVAVILISGARPQEMLKYEANHFDGERLTLPIQDSKGKKRSRVVHLPPLALEIVKRLAEQYPDGKLFRTKAGIPWDRNSLRCRFRALKKKMSMPKLCATTLRHSWAHHRLESGQDSLIVSKLMGHVDGRMLATRYGHIEEGQRLGEEAKKIIPLLDLGNGPNTFPNQPVES
jgi:integrase